MQQTAESSRGSRRSPTAQTFLRFPLLTLKIIRGIHWEALRLWLKGLPRQPHPQPPINPVAAGAGRAWPCSRPCSPA
ncbi:MAG TPA: DUF1365 family protein [Stellaceae bacterium]|nr:DUF1365 family protein [Stellaceae bacterium]